MNTRSTLPRYIRMSSMVILIAILAVSFNPTAASINPLPAIDTIEEGTRRADMLAIADRYVNYTWTAINSDWGMSQNTNELHASRVDTPDVNYCGSAAWGCWDKGPVTNVGVPYYWGGATSVEDYPNDGIPDLNLKPHDGVPLRHFGEKLALGYPAGNIRNFGEPQWNLANGVDCIGFIGQVWRTGTRLNMPSALEKMRPIRFQDLRAGDVVQRYISGSTINHVVLFRNWINYNPGVEIVQGIFCKLVKVILVFLGCIRLYPSTGSGQALQNLYRFFQSTTPR